MQICSSILQHPTEVGRTLNRLRRVHAGVTVDLDQQTRNSSARETILPFPVFISQLPAVRVICVNKYCVNTFWGASTEKETTYFSVKLKV